MKTRIIASKFLKKYYFTLNSWFSPFIVNETELPRKEFIQGNSSI